MTIQTAQAKWAAWVQAGLGNERAMTPSAMAARSASVLKVMGRLLGKVAEPGDAKPRRWAGLQGRSGRRCAGLSDPASRNGRQSVRLALLLNGAGGRNDHGGGIAAIFAAVKPAPPF